MLGTITIGSCVSVQGEIVARLPNGRLSVRVGKRVFTGRAVGPAEPVCAVEEGAVQLHRVA
ncbi:MAG: hypothetical protein D6686_02390 [Alphaproteobacteria bacterium]|nr:MAG: hypothetical protein D6686_02390 [Alphaproteobacteria bacterium]